MPPVRRTQKTMYDYLMEYDQLIEVGIGRRTDLAAELAKSGISVTATDVYQRDVPDDVCFVRDDIVDPDPSVYAAADAVYARNLPPELHRPALEVAQRADATFLFTTLGGDQPTVPVERRTIAKGTLYVARGTHR